MAKAIETTPILEGKEASRILNILENVESIKLTRLEKEVKNILRDLPAKLKL